MTRDTKNKIGKKNLNFYKSDIYIFETVQMNTNTWDGETMSHSLVAVTPTSKLDVISYNTTAHGVEKGSFQHNTVSSFHLILMTNHQTIAPKKISPKIDTLWKQPNILVFIYISLVLSPTLQRASFLLVASKNSFYLFFFLKKK